MSKIQIKRYNGSTTSWENQFPVTKAQHIVATDGTSPIFDGSDKINIAYLPNAVFDSLYFYSTVTSGPSSLASLADAARLNAASIGRSALGYYWVANGSAGVTTNPSSATQIGSVYYLTELNPSDEGTYGSGITGTSMEAGDWLVITKITGLGTSVSPFVYVFGIVENTYEDAATNVKGIVTLSSQTVWANLAGNNVITDAKLKALVDGQNYSVSGHTHLLAAGATDVTATASELNLLDGELITTTELNYLAGVTSAIQTQIDGKAATSHTHTVANITDLTATATELNYTDGVTSNIQTQLNAKANLAGPTFTGTVVLPSTTSIGNVDSTEIGYLDGVTSAIQTQLNAKQATITGAATTIVSSNLTASRAVVSDASGKIAASTITLTELGYLSGATGNIQGNINALSSRVRVYYDGTPTGMVTDDIWFDAV
jgi:hypothetical protein